MTISRIKAWHMVDPDAARKQILSAFQECEGCAEETAEQLGVHYQTLFRLMKSDPVLSDAIVMARLKFIAKGVVQRGWGDWHELSAVGEATQ